VTKLTKAERLEIETRWQRETERIRCQRQAFAFVPTTPAVEFLKRAMLDRAWYLLDAGECDAADSILEFLPAAEAEKLLHDYFGV